MMTGINVDELKVEYKSKVYMKKRAIIGLCNKRLTLDNSYMAIISPEFIQ